jgi:hypothetical protein
MWSINPISNPYPFYSHTLLNRDNINCIKLTFSVLVLQVYLISDSVRHFVNGYYGCPVRDVTGSKVTLGKARVPLPNSV